MRLLIMGWLLVQKIPINFLVIMIIQDQMIMKNFQIMKNLVKIKKFIEIKKNQVSFTIKEIQ